MGIGVGRRGHGPLHERRIAEADSAAHDFPRQHEVRGAARRGHHDLHRAGDHVRRLVGRAQLVVPLHDLAHEARLIEHFLRPMDVSAPPAVRLAFGDRRPAGQQ